MFSCYILELPPTQDASHHPDYSIFSRESQPKPSFVTLLGGGVDQSYNHRIVIFVYVPVWWLFFHDTLSGDPGE